MSNSTPRVFAISDLHLSGTQQNKEMIVFGMHWDNHWDRIREDWCSKVEPDDIVLIPGDISWAMTLEEAYGDLMQIAELPGRKCILRGNHDYWWSAIGRLRELLPERMYALQNDAIVFDGVTICGTRGWVVPNPIGLAPEDHKVYQREIQRLSMSLSDALRRAPGQKIVAMLHYPPFNEHREASGFTELLAQYNVSCAVYGHLHGPSLRNVFEGVAHSVFYHMVSCDYLGFRLAELVY